MQLNILEAKTQLSQLIKAAHEGADVVIANRGQPVARLVPVNAAETLAPAAPASGSAAAFLRHLADKPLPAYARRSAAEIDAAIAEERDAWA